jgi:hypothetical protein
MFKGVIKFFPKINEININFSCLGLIFILEFFYEKKKKLGMAYILILYGRNIFPI